MQAKDVIGLGASAAPSTAWHTRLHFARRLLTNYIWFEGAGRADVKQAAYFAIQQVIASSLETVDNEQLTELATLRRDIHIFMGAPESEDEFRVLGRRLVSKIVFTSRNIILEFMLSCWFRLLDELAQESHVPLSAEFMLNLSTIRLKLINALMAREQHTAAALVKEAYDWTRLDDCECVV